MQDEDKIFGLIVQAEDIQRHAIALQHTAQDAIKTHLEASRAAVRDAAREFITEAAEKASTGLLEASNDAKASSATLRRTGLMQGIFLLAVALVVIGATYAAGSFLFKSRVDELAELKAQVTAERATLDELRSKTWGLELVSYQDGTKGIILPESLKIDRTGELPDGRAAIVVK